MRLSEVLGSSVTGSTGTSLGVVVDVRLVHRGPVRGVLQQLEVESLLVGRRRPALQALGYDRRDQQRPLVLRVLVRAWVGTPSVVPWHEVSRVTPGSVRLVRDDLPAPQS
jgi:sporulation protein YlmC with PRC-barrel domain